MKKILILILVFAYFNSNAQGIKFFKGSLEEAKALAKKEDKLIFMDCYTAWCGPCKRMAKNVFPQKEAGDYFNENFINVQKDMEKGEGRSIAKKYGVRSYPTLIFLDYSGNVVYQTKGARRDAESLIQLGKQALKPSKNVLRTLQKKWDDGNREQSFLKEFIKVKSVLENDYEEVFSEYLNNIPEEEKKSEDNLTFVYKYTKKINSKGLDFISNNAKAFKEYFGKEVFDKKINSIAVESVSSVDGENAKQIMSDVTALLKKFKPEGYKKQTNYIETKLYGRLKDWNAYDKSVSKYLKKYKKNDEAAYRNVAWNYYMYIDDNSKLTKAEKWMQKAVNLENSYENNLTQAYLLYKLKRYSDAQDAVEYAIILAKDSNKRTKNAKMLKDKIAKALKGEKKTVVIDYEVD